MVKPPIVFFLVALTVFLSVTVTAETENDWTRKFCPEEAQFVRLEDGTFPDCTMWGYVIEVDWATRTKIYEGLGQALWYADLSGMRPALVLLTSGKGSCKHVATAKRIASSVGIFLATYPVKCSDVEVVPTVTGGGDE